MPKILLEGLSKELVLGRVVELNLKDKEMIIFEKMENGTWRLTYTKQTIPEVSKLQSLKIVRESKPEETNNGKTST